MKNRDASFSGSINDVNLTEVRSWLLIERRELASEYLTTTIEVSKRFIIQGFELKAGLDGRSQRRESLMGRVNQNWTNHQAADLCFRSSMTKVLRSGADRVSCCGVALLR